MMPITAHLPWANHLTAFWGEFFINQSGLRVASLTSYNLGASFKLGL